jgi:hypothetical protein
MRGQFGQDYIRGEFDLIGDTLSEPLECYLIGGGAMVFQDLKDATKDIDVIVQASSDLRQLQNVLGRLDYEPERARRRTRRAGCSGDSGERGRLPVRRL